MEQLEKDTLELFFENRFWEEAIQKSAEKHLDTGTLRYFCTTEGRVRLLEDMLAGEYVIQPPTVVRIPKDNGEFREIFVNTPKDRIILTIVNSVFNDIYKDKLSCACRAYLKGMSTQRTVLEISKKPKNGYKLDLSKYFDSVPIEILNKALTELDTGSPVDDIIYNYYNNNTVIVNGRKTSRFKSLAQGCALASFLSNYVLKEVDEKMLAMCDCYIRYSDDMLLLGDDSEEALKVLVEMLHKLGLTLNPDKIEKISDEVEFKFLGFGLLGDKILMSDKDFKTKKIEIKQIIKQIAGKELLSMEGLQKAIKEINNLLYGIASNQKYGWVQSKVIINDLEKIKELDNFIKEHLRAAVTGRWNFTHNCNKVPKEMLESYGYISLVHMFKVVTLDRTLFESEVLRCIKQPSTQRLFA